jgi:hypothetical protein
MKFTTKDQDNDEYSPFNCATNFHGAWWYENCHDSYLNENYLGGSHTSFAVIALVNGYELLLSKQENITVVCSIVSTKNITS